MTSGQEKLKKIAIIGLPNTGKSQVFNNLTGDYTLVANFPLTTVEMKSGRTKIGKDLYEVVDTPGLHCLYIHSEEELIVRDLLLSDRPDIIIQCIDANRLKQSLVLTADLLEFGIPMVVSLNAIDETTRRGMWIDSDKLSKMLGVPVVDGQIDWLRKTSPLSAYDLYLTETNLDYKTVGLNSGESVTILVNENSEYPGDDIKVYTSDVEIGVFSVYAGPLLNMMTHVGSGDTSLENIHSFDAIGVPGGIIKYIKVQSDGGKVVLQDIHKSFGVMQFSESDTRFYSRNATITGYKIEDGVSLGIENPWEKGNGKIKTRIDEQGNSTNEFVKSKAFYLRGSNEAKDYLVKAAIKDKTKVKDKYRYGVAAYHNSYPSKQMFVLEVLPGEGKVRLRFRAGEEGSLVKKTLTIVSLPPKFKPKNNKFLFFILALSGISEDEEGHVNDVRIRAMLKTPEFEIFDVYDGVFSLGGKRRFVMNHGQAGLFKSKDAIISADTVLIYSLDPKIFISESFDESLISLVGE